MEEKFVWDVRSKYVILLNNLNCTIYRIYSRIKRVSQYWLRIDGFLLLNTPQIQRRNACPKNPRHAKEILEPCIHHSTGSWNRDASAHASNEFRPSRGKYCVKPNEQWCTRGDNDTKISCFLYLITISNLRIGNRAIIAVESTLFVGPLESNEEMHANTNARGGRDNNARRGDK